MKNVTITVEEDVARWAKVWAARHDTSLSRMLGEELRHMMEREEGYDLAQQRFMAQKPQILKDPGTPYPKRDTLYDR
jgi:hypothetical protein